MLGQKTNCPILLIRIALPEVIDGVVSDIVTIKARLIGYIDLLSTNFDFPIRVTQIMVSLGYQMTYTLANQDDPHAVIIECIRVVLFHFTFVLCTMHMIPMITPN